MGYNDEDKSEPFYPVRISKCTDPETLTVNVLLIGNDVTTHFVLIKSLNALLKKPNTRLTKYHCVR